MPAMLYTIPRPTGRFTICRADIQSEADEQKFIKAAREQCEFLKVELEPQNIIRYHTCWEMNSHTASYVDRFDWPKAQKQMELFEGGAV